MNKSITFLLATARTGTTYLRSILSSASGVKVYGEFLWPGFFPWGFYAYYRERVSNDSAQLFRRNERGLLSGYFEYMDALHPDTPVVMDLKMEQANEFHSLVDAAFVPKYQFIMLTRDDLLGQVASEMVMYQRIREGDLEVHRSTVPEPTVLIRPPEEYLQRILSKMSLNAKYRDALRRSGCDCIEVTYEEITGPDKAAHLDRVAEFVGVHLEGLSSPLVKQNPYSIRDIVSNFDEVVECLRGNGISVLESF